MGLAKFVKTGGVMISAKGALDPEALAERQIRGINFVNKRRLPCWPNWPN